MRSLFKVNKSERAALRRKVGEELRAHREREGVSVEGRAVATTLPAATVRGLEAGRGGIELGVLLKVCEFLDLDMWDLLIISYRDVLYAKGMAAPLAFEQSRDRFGVAMAYLWVGLPVSSLAFVRWCCGKPFACGCVTSCSCTCVGCHLSVVQLRALLRTWRPRPVALRDPRRAQRDALPRRTGLHLSRKDRTVNTTSTPAQHKPQTLTLPEREKLVQDFAERYRQGESIRAIAEDAGRPYGTVHRWLAEGGIQMRPRGGSRQKPVPESASADARGC